MTWDELKNLLRVLQGYISAGTLLGLGVALLLWDVGTHATISYMGTVLLLSTLWAPSMIVIGAVTGLMAGLIFAHAELQLMREAKPQIRWDSRNK